MQRPGFLATSSKLLGTVINVLLFTFVGIMLVITFFQILSRFVFRIPIVWSEEVIRMSFVWLIFLGSAMAIKENSHLSLDLLTTSLTPKARRWISIGIYLIILAISIVLFIAGGDYVRRSLGKLAVTMRIPANAVNLAIPVSSAVAILFTIERILGVVRQDENGERE